MEEEYRCAGCEGLCLTPEQLERHQQGCILWLRWRIECLEDSLRVAAGLLKERDAEAEANREQITRQFARNTELRREVRELTQEPRSGEGNWEP